MEPTVGAYGPAGDPTGHPGGSGASNRTWDPADAPAFAAAAIAVVGALAGERLAGRDAVPSGPTGAVPVLLVVLALTAVGTAVVHRPEPRATTTARRRRTAIALLVLGALVTLRADAEWRAVSTTPLGAWTGWATVATDPVPRGSAVSVVLGLDGRRHEAWAYGHVRHRVASLEAGDRVWVAGVRMPYLEATARRRASVRHVVARLRLDIVADVRDGTPLSIAANRVRDMLRGAAERSMSAEHAALFTGLVIGDDARQDRAMVDDFRDAGLSHLTAVSGQNVAFVLLAARPVLSRLPPRARWLVTIGLLGAFVVVARAEPSVLRAALMAALSATAFAIGRPVRPLRLLALAVAGLLAVDPFLVRSVGFWLSVGATAGVCAVSPVVERRLPGPRWAVVPVALTLGAQAGVALPALAVFGRLPLVALVANPLAGPVAGGVMLAGLPAAAGSAALAALGLGGLGDLVMWPLRTGTRWVAQVAQVGAALEVPLAPSVLGWIALGLWVALRRARTAVQV